MVLYVEACESGSMFKNILSKNINGIFYPNFGSFQIYFSDNNNSIPFCKESEVQLFKLCSHNYIQISVCDKDNIRKSCTVNFFLVVSLCAF